MFLVYDYELDTIVRQIDMNISLKEIHVVP